MTYNPSKLYNFEAGYLLRMVQRTSLFLMLRLTALWTPHFASKAANSPFIGETLKGQVKYTICKGQIVYQN